MKMRALLGFRSRLIKPCSKIFSVFVFRFHKPSFSSFRAPRFRIHSRRSRLRSTRVVRFRKPFSIRAIKFPRCHPKTRLRFRRPVAVKRSLRLRLRFKRKRRASAVTTPTSASVSRRRAGGGGASGGGHNNGERFGEKIAELLSVFKSSRRSKELEQVMDLKSVSDMDSTDHHHHNNNNAKNLVSNGSIRDGKEPFPSPITPAFVRKLSDSKKDNSSSDTLNGDDEEEDDDNVVDEEAACRNFESYLAEMIVEDRKVTDLMDVEELLYCWRSLKSPMFVDLVGHFYGEMCKDLFFTGEEEEEEDGSSNTT